MKDDKNTHKALERLCNNISAHRGKLVKMFVEIVEKYSRKYTFDRFIAYFANNQDATRLEVIRDMILNGWIHINEELCIEIGENMPTQYMKDCFVDAESETE